MSSEDEVNRRDLIIGAAGAIGVVAATTVAARTAEAAQTPPPGFDLQEPLRKNWNTALGDLVNINPSDAAKDLKDPGGQERHRIYCYLLMKLIHRFWNGNKKGPFGTYPWRSQQQDMAQVLGKPKRYRGDIIADPSSTRVTWDRYLGHNIACLAVDGHGEIIDFEFNHNELFRSTAEHAESRMVRRLFSLTSIFDNWQTGRRIKERPALLTDVTLYTSLESCAQCSGVMSLAGIKQIVYLQNDFTAYKIGNIMYALANHLNITDENDKTVNVPGAPIPIAGSDVGLGEFKELNDANLDFTREITESGAAKPPNKERAFFVPDNGGPPDFAPSVTSFLCTDRAREIFAAGASKLDNLPLSQPQWAFPDLPKDPKIKTNQECLDHARAFYKYADVEGYRGTPHKL